MELLRPFSDVDRARSVVDVAYLDDIVLDTHGNVAFRSRWIQSIGWLARRAISRLRLGPPDLEVLLAELVGVHELLAGLPVRGQLLLGAGEA